MGKSLNSLNAAAAFGNCRLKPPDLSPPSPQVRQGGVEVELAEVQPLIDQVGWQSVGCG